MRKLPLLIVLFAFLAGCGQAAPQGKSAAEQVLPPAGTALAPLLSTPTPAFTATITPTPTPTLTPTIAYNPSGIPVFEHVIVILFENHNYKEVIGNPKMPEFNRLAKENTLFTAWHAVAHPSLPNYIALIGGDTFDITSDCGECYVNQESLPDRIEASGRTWKTYQEGMPSACALNFTETYDVNHDPFVYFDPVRIDSARCERSVLPLTALDADLAANRLPNFAFIMPNLCNSGHNCGMDVSDAWLKQMIGKLQKSPALGRNYAIFVMYDEAEDDNSSCCGMPEPAGGRVAAFMISPLAKPAFQDGTPYSHYSLLKTILSAWSLPDLGHTADEGTQPVIAPFK